MKPTAVRLFALVATALLLLLPCVRGQTTSTLITLHSFPVPDASDGESFGGPQGDLVQGSDGDFYGTTYRGGLGDGTVFKIKTNGESTVLHAFGLVTDGINSDGTLPTGALVEGGDGNFYGTTVGGGKYGAGTAYRISPNGALTTLHHFDVDDGINPYGGVILGRDGNFYGVTRGGGLNGGAGVLFRMTPGGTVTTVYGFSGVNGPGDAGTPQAAPTQGQDGNFYGTTYFGGSYAAGSIYRITPDGQETVLFSFAGGGRDGVQPDASLIKGIDGNFYGTTHQGGQTGNGSVFQITPDGAFTTLHFFGTFAGDGTDSVAALHQEPGGNFYGTTATGGAYNAGTIFEITPAGALTILYNFGATDGHNVNARGARPTAGVILGQDGNLYGTTYYGGSGADGTVFALNLTGSPVPPSTVSIAAGGDGISVEGGKEGVAFITRTEDVSTPLKVNYKAKGAAKPGVDYKKLSGSITIPAGATKAKIKIKPIDGSPNAGTLKIKLVLVAPSDGSYTVGTGTAKIKLIGK